MIIIEVEEKWLIETKENAENLVRIARHNCLTARQALKYVLDLGMKIELEKLKKEFEKTQGRRGTRKKGGQAGAVPAGLAFRPDFFGTEDVVKVIKLGGARD